MRIVATLTVTLLLLAACSGEPEVREPDPSPSASAETPSSAPTMPAQAREDSDEGSVAFVNHWIGLFNHAVQSGDGEPLRDAGPDCEECSGYADDFEGIAASERPTADVWNVQKLGIVGGTGSENVVSANVAVATSGGEESTYQLFFRLTDSPPYEVTRVTREVSR